MDRKLKQTSPHTQPASKTSRSPISETNLPNSLSFYIKEYQRIYRLLTLREQGKPAHSVDNQINRSHNRAQTSMPIKIDDEMNQMINIEIGGLPNSNNLQRNSFSNEATPDHSKNYMKVNDFNLPLSNNSLLVSHSNTVDLLEKSKENLKSIHLKCGRLPNNIEAAVQFVLEKSDPVDRGPEESIEAARAIEIVKERVIGYIISHTDVINFFQSIIFDSERTAAELLGRSKEDMIELMMKKSRIFEAETISKRKILELYELVVEIER